LIGPPAIRAGGNSTRRYRPFYNEFREWIEGPDDKIHVLLARSGRPTTSGGDRHRERLGRPELLRDRRGRTVASRRRQVFTVIWTVWILDHCVESYGGLRLTRLAPNSAPRADAVSSRRPIGRPVWQSAVTRDIHAKIKRSRRKRSQHLLRSRRRSATCIRPCQVTSIAMGIRRTTCESVWARYFAMLVSHQPHFQKA
jgi:hypothetical protein